MCPMGVITAGAMEGQIIVFLGWYLIEEIRLERELKLLFFAAAALILWLFECNPLRIIAIIEVINSSFASITTSPLPPISCMHEGPLVHNCESYLYQLIYSIIQSQIDYIYLA